MTASVTGSPRKSSAVFFIFISTLAEISGGAMLLAVGRFPTQASPLSWAMMLVRHQVEILLHFGIGELAADQALHRG
jgi:hypothetical protein